jgi:predicted phage terminase large subunit-like protein
MNSHVDQHALLHAILRQDFEAFVRKVFHALCPGQTFIPVWFIKAVAYQLERVRRGEIRRLIINMPPRSLKSIMASVAFPAFVLGHDPTRRIICASYSGEYARRLSNDFRAVLGSPWYQDAFRGTRIGPYKDSETEVELIRRGFRLATSTGGTLTGRGGDLIVIDDPLKPIDAMSEPKRNAANEWFLSTVISRLDDKRTGAIVIVMQRVHIDDLTGFVLRQPDDWTVLSLPAIAEGFESIPIAVDRVHERRPGEVLSPEREPREVLDRMRLQLGSDLFYAQYQQSPVPPGGLMIQRSWVRRYTEVPPAAAGSFVFQSWDTAAKGGPGNDWSVCSTWLLTNDCQFYLLDVWRARVDYPTLKAKVEELAKQWGAHQVLVEEAGTAIGLLAELKYRVRGLTGIKPDRDKETRMSIASALFEAGQVHFPERAVWLAELEAELFSFPASRHDDQVDSISQAINHTRSSALWVWKKLGQNYVVPSSSTMCQSASVYVSQYMNVFSRGRW